jgi:hypothetical protein
MVEKEFKVFKVPVTFFFLGVLFLIIGANGTDLAVTFSRPTNASSWSTADSLINAFTYVPMMIGISFLLVFAMTFSIAFYLLQKNR